MDAKQVRSKSPRKRVGRRLALLMLVASVVLFAFFSGMGAGALAHPWTNAVYFALAMNLGRYNHAEVFNRHPQQQATLLPPDCGPSPAPVQDELRNRFRIRHFLCPTTHSQPVQRVEFLVGNELAEPVLMKGEVGTFLDHCPGPWGCLAVQYSRLGAVVHGWPFRPDAIAAVNSASALRYPYKHPLSWSFAQEISEFAIAPFPDGDLLVTFRLDNSLPAGGGVARIAPDGQPRWYRKDYSHGSPHVIDEDAALVLATPPSLQGRPRCGHQHALRTIDRRGEVMEEIAVIQAIEASPFSSYLRTVDCDPSHVNFVHVLGEDALGDVDFGPGDLVISLRNLSAFGILDKNDRRLKRFVRGSFLRQHGVRHLTGTRFLMLDNLGTDGVYGPSRLLIVDLATSEEITVFPNDATPEDVRDWFVPVGGQFDVSADGRRALVVDPHGARAFEVRLADGRVLNVFRQIHDLSGLEGRPEQLVGDAALFQFNGIHYASRWQGT